jgi:hypothetical protein
LINAPADCPIAYRICDVTQSYNFALIDDGLIDDAHGSIEIPGLSKSSPTQFESKSAWIEFTPQYSGEFGFTICPETPENFDFILFQNPNCNNIEIGVYSLMTVASGGQTFSEPVHGCTGLGYEPYTGLSGETFADWQNYINIVAGNTYKIFVTTGYYLQTGTHRFTIRFTGAVVTSHPDLFNYPGCTMSTNAFVKDNTSIYPNPFSDVLQIESDTVFQKLELYDVLGKQIMNRDFINQIDTSSFAQGMYFLKLYTEDGEVVVKKVVRE